MGINKDLFTLYWVVLCCVEIFAVLVSYALLVGGGLPTLQDREYFYIKVRLLALEVSSVELWKPGSYS
jgi:hypothetical protein